MQSRRLALGASTVVTVFLIYLLREKADGRSHIHNCPQNLRSCRSLCETPLGEHTDGIQEVLRVTPSQEKRDNSNPMHHIKHTLPAAIWKRMLKSLMWGSYRQGTDVVSQANSQAGNSPPGYVCLWLICHHCHACWTPLQVIKLLPWHKTTQRYKKDVFGHYRRLHQPSERSEERQRQCKQECTGGLRRQKSKPFSWLSLNCHTSSRCPKEQTLRKGFIQPPIWVSYQIPLRTRIPVTWAKVSQGSSFFCWKSNLKLVSVAHHTLPTNSVSIATRILWFLMSLTIPVGSEMNLPLATTANPTIISTSLSLQCH